MEDERDVVQDLFLSFSKADRYHAPVGVGEIWSAYDEIINFCFLGQPVLSSFTWTQQN